MPMIIHRESSEKIFLYIAILFLFFMIGGCTAPPLVLIEEKAIPQFSDDLDVKSIEKAIEGSIQYYNRVPATDGYLFGDKKYDVQDLKASLLTFKHIIQSTDSDEIKTIRIIETFDIYKAIGSDNKGTVLFTGYYEPILDGSLVQSDKYKYPVYKTPDDLVNIQPEVCEGSKKCGNTICRIENDKIMPYYSREEIDSFSVLSGRNLEIAWLSDPIGLFFLHIQGSGKIRLPDGSYIQISYAQSNGRPYRGIAKYLLDTNKISANKLSYQSIKTYLREHHEELTEIFNHNERYIFFRIVDQGPIGALGVVVTANRSIATDPSIFPRGALAYVKLQKPILDHEKKDVIDWRPFSRFVFNQDEGSAIKGPGRVDIFCGAGEEAELFAGSLKEKGELYFLIKKK